MQQSAFNHFFQLPSELQPCHLDPFMFSLFCAPITELKLNRSDSQSSNKGFLYKVASQQTGRVQVWQGQLEHNMITRTPYPIPTSERSTKICHKPSPAKIILTIKNLNLPIQLMEFKFQSTKRHLDTGFAVTILDPVLMPNWYTPYLVILWYISQY